MIVFDCAVCRTKLRAEQSQVGTWVLCPNCRTKLQVPAVASAPSVSAPVAASSASGEQNAGANRPGLPASQSAGQQSFNQTAGGAPRRGGTATVPRPGSGAGFRPTSASGRRYGFNCGYCSSRLEATEAMAAQDGQCPTCGNSITIPIQDRYGRLIDPKTRQIIKQDPHPVHAYAAAGDRAPAILRQNDGKQIIRCPRCAAASPISANNCKACGMPFTMEGTTLEAAGSSNGFAVASLVLGIIGVPAAVTLLPSILAITFGIIGFVRISGSGTEGGGKGMAVAGIVLGCLGGIIGCYVDFLK